jgi:glycine/D-amino acid oxidase-like deaminating enzyme/nitrite reductase/ring-hydroxylating ferredoxin subunit
MKQDTATKVTPNQSVWASYEMPEFEPLRESIRTDVCIIGAGIAGLSAAYMLREAGKKVVVLDDGPVAGGMTAMTTAHLSNEIDDRFIEIERLHGAAGAHLAAESHSAAINRIELIAKKEKISCDFERLDGYLFLGPGQTEELLNRELLAAHRAGLNEVQKYECAPIDCFDTGPCLCFPNQGMFHPLKYLAGLAKAVTRDGGQIFSGTHADQVESGPLIRVTANNHTISADSVIIATNTPINDRLVIHTKQAPYMTYVIGAQVPHGSVPKALYRDMLDPYHYVRLQAHRRRGGHNGAGGHDILIVGGEDHKTGQADHNEERFLRLEHWARERFPMMGDVEFTWSGQVMETVDGLAFIGRNPMDSENVFIVTGDSGMGMPHGTIAGILLTDLIMGRSNSWASLYDPSRKTLGSIRDFAMENVIVAMQYTDYFTGGDVRSTDEILPGSGAIVRRGLVKIAAFRDEAGVLHECSAICPHLGCIVHWNRTEKTWDCPCHGSRFTPVGKVMNGPANSNLSPADGK